MNYVYKVQGDFDSIDFGKILDKLLTDFLFIYLSGDLFLALKDYKKQSISKDILKKYFKQNKFLITEVTESILSRQSLQAKDWCVDQFVRLDLQKFEDEQQETLKDSWRRLDQMEEDLKLKLRNNYTAN